MSKAKTTKRYSVKKVAKPRKTYGMGYNEGFQAGVASMESTYTLSASMGYPTDSEPTCADPWSRLRVEPVTPAPLDNPVTAAEDGPPAPRWSSPCDATSPGLYLVESADGSFTIFRSVTTLINATSKKETWYEAQESKYVIHEDVRNKMKRVYGPIQDCKE